MMTCLFVHDTKFYQYNGLFYTNNLSDKIWEARYLSVFDELIVCGRQREGDSHTPEKYTLSSVDKVNFSNIASYTSSLSFIHRYKKIRRDMEDTVRRADFVICRVPSILGSLAIAACIRQNKPYLVEVVACAFEAYWWHSFLGKVIAPFIELVTKREIKRAGFAMYVTNRYLQSRYPTNGKSLSCSDVWLGELDESVILKRRKHIENGGGKIILGTVAAVNVRFKGQQYIIQALSKLKNQGITNFEYQLVGGGDTDYLKAVAKKSNVSDQVKFLGSLPHHQVMEWLDTIDIYTQPSRQEGLPRALIEAMSRGLPAFGAETAGIPELLDLDFIFSNTKRNIDEICALLKKYNKDILLSQSIRNYKEAKKYDKAVIDACRQSFFDELFESMRYPA